MMTFYFNPNDQGVTITHFTGVGDPVPGKTCICCNVGMVFAMASCPDNHPGCCAMHWGVRCPKCGGATYEHDDEEAPCAYCGEMAQKPHDHAQVRIQQESKWDQVAYDAKRRAEHLSQFGPVPYNSAIDEKGE